MCNGFIRLPRSIITDTLWKDLSSRERHVFMTLLHHVAFSDYTMNDHGILINVKPLQFLTTERQLVKICNDEKPKDMKEFDKSFLRRTLSKLKLIGFSDQEVNHKKTLVTITWSDIVKLSEPGFEPKVNQERTKSEPEKKKDKKIKKEKNILLASEIATSLLSRFSLSLSSNLPEISLEVKKEQAHEFDKLLKQGYEIDQIVDVIEFSHTDSFWRAHVHSPSYLVKKFAKLLIKCQESKKGNQHAATKKYSQHSNSENLDKSGDPKFEAGRSLRF